MVPKFVQVLPLSMIALSCVIVAARLAIMDKGYAAFLIAGGIIAYWTACVLEKIGK